MRDPSESDQGNVLSGFDLLKVLPVVPSVFLDLLKRPPALKPKCPNLGPNFLQILLFLARNIAISHQKIVANKHDNE